MDDQNTIAELLKLLQGGGTAGLAVFGFLIYKEFKELRQTITSITSMLRVRQTRVESWLEATSGGKFKSWRDDDDRDGN